ncbi:hypothetical protein [Labedaea rhizosphaerae]|uniref:Uncharacterized protein n=1 Tax=Labedaea rhizosphaerae TaxID=598644 RepID=A0A4R6S946_LABRH|nr:hypothetical protein [Labedaea rhizosphaerae]TDP96380.1 hypothetical protein EV186_104365 [Labedaea rhizosphaerae]
MTEEPKAGSWDYDKLLISAISLVNPHLGRYALHLVDVDAGRGEQLPPAEELQLGRAVVELGVDIQRRAEQRGGELPGATAAGGQAVDEEA